ncbi:LPS export ABC transporter periplasmic protein LptC [Polymorphobacter multimanifer]|nr:LPS export ABC transporter periplasmic protein LptC [Polymorphobacter multimanifer]
MALTPRQRRALPGSRHERVMGVLKWLLPTLATLLLAAIIVVPLSSVQEFSFLLAKDRVEMAPERLRVVRASYRGETERGEAFLIEAERAVQKSSAVPEVDMSRLAARLEGDDGLTLVTAPSGTYFLETNKLRMSGPISLDSQAGYTVETGTVDVDLNERSLASREAVTGKLPIGDFRADRLSADVEGRVLVLEGRAHLRINGGRGRAG